MVIFYPLCKSLKPENSYWMAHKMTQWILPWYCIDEGCKL